MTATRSYVDELRGIARRAVAGRLKDSEHTRVTAELDGRFGRYIIRRVSRVDRLAAGAFFTGTSTSTALIAPLVSMLRRGASVFDPACGSGDLLLAAARELPVRRTVEATLALWSDLISGRDLHQELVDVSKARLALLAWQRSNRSDRSKRGFNSFFPNIRVGNGLKSTAGWSAARIAVMNPPFRLVRLPEGTEWGTGRATEASEFVEAFLQNAAEGAHLAAVLPDSLRSGSRYERLRETVEGAAKIVSIDLHGRLPGADIDVFILHGTKSKKGGPAPNWSVAPTSARTVGTYFDVSVGSVVPHRDAKRGPVVQYLHARCLPLSGELNGSPENRRFAGRTVLPPFVLVRRTSKPRQRRRITATLVLGDSPIAVENHLLILKPRDGKVDTCRVLLRRLTDSSAAIWMNQRIRCRHLTVQSIKELPWLEST